jgi:hypothetical protein
MMRFMRCYAAACVAIFGLAFLFFSVEFIRQPATDLCAWRQSASCVCMAAMGTVLCSLVWKVMR